MKKLFIFVVLIALAFLVYPQFVSISRALELNGAYSSKSSALETLIASAEKDGTVRVIVGLRSSFVPEGQLKSAEAELQRNSIATAQDALLDTLSNVRVTSVKRFEYIPFIAFEADAAALRLMRNDPLVTSIEEDVIGEPGLAESTALVGANVAWTAGYSGLGQTVAIIDSGVDKTHSFFTGRVVSEACYSSNVAGTSVSFCPGAVTETTAPDSGVHCPTSVPGCAHGTHVAGIAAGNGAAIDGVARDANIIAIQIFSRFETTTACGGPAPCARYWTSDLIKGLERVRTLRLTNPNIAAVNLSLQTGQQFTSNCDVSHAATKTAIDNLRSLNVATAICSGNYAFTNALTAPACISSSISVGSVDDGSDGTSANAVSSFSDSSPLLHLLAPGRWIQSSVPGNIFEVYAGTSMATPHVTGAFAIMRQKYPNASVGQIYKALAVSGLPVTDSRNGIVKPRINIGAALNALRTSPFDFDDDGRTDIGIIRNSSSKEWWVNRSSTGLTFATSFGTSTDIDTPSDFTGDGKTDIAVFRPSTGSWYTLRSEDLTFYAFPFGASGDTPAPGDFDGDGKADATVFRASNQTWYQLLSGGGSPAFQFGAAGDKPVVGDYDGDGKSDIAIFRPSDGSWWIQRSTAGLLATAFGAGTDKAVPGDYTGDGKTDVAVWRPSTGFWYFLRSEDLSYFSFPWGGSGDIPASGDYDGDGKWDASVFRPSDATWYINRSTGTPLITAFGANGDRPIPNSFVP